MRNRLAIDTPELTDKVVIAVHAPAGFGKTFLLTQWRRECLSHGAVVAWLTLDVHDDGARFVQGLGTAMAIGSGRPSFARAFERVPGSGRDEFEGLTQWLAEVADLGSETVLILDEADALPEATVGHSLTYLLHNAPAQFARHHSLSRTFESAGCRPGGEGTVRDNHHDRIAVWR